MKKMKYHFFVLASVADTIVLHYAKIMQNKVNGLGNRESEDTDEIMPFIHLKASIMAQDKEYFELAKREILGCEEILNESLNQEFKSWLEGTDCVQDYKGVQRFINSLA